MLQLKGSRNKKRAKAKSKAKKEKAREQRAESYQDRLEQRLLDQSIGREAREQAQLSGQVLPGREDDLSDQSSVASSDSEEEAQSSSGEEVDPLSASEIQKRQNKIGNIGVKRIPRSLKKEFKRAAKKDADSYRISGTGLALSTEGQKGPFDEDFGEGAVFWRGDTRPPREVLKTGFTPKVARDLGTDSPGGTKKKRPNTIIYRTGDDDIVPASGVCVTPDIRGACFFPFSARERSNEKRHEHAYLYALSVRQATNTFKAQKAAERAETGNRRWRDPKRFRYDPQESRTAQASTVWPYREHVVHSVAPEQVIGGWRLTRERLVNPEKTGDDVKAGMRFRVDPKSVSRSLAKSKQPDRLKKEAMRSVKEFSRFYPRHPDHFLSYQGTVRKSGEHPTSTAEAEQRATQIDPFPSPPSRLSKRKLAWKERLARREEEKRRFKHPKIDQHPGKKKRPLSYQPKR